jgi:HAD superfamily hydrolase (TIGR01549 family)
MKKKYNFFIFDLDGVIFDSKENMFFSWNATKKKFKLKPTFASYFKNIGKPFDEIMKSINIKPNPRITSCYKENSLKYIKKIKLYSNVRKILQILNRRNIKFSIVTSKDRTRTKFLLNKFKIYPHSIHCPRKNILGKPNPKLLFSAIKKNRLNDLKVCYVGDTYIDQQAAKNAGIDFILAKYGYSNKKFPKNQSSIKSFKDLKPYII